MKKNDSRNSQGSIHYFFRKSIGNGKDNWNVCTTLVFHLYCRPKASAKWWRIALTMFFINDMWTPTFPTALQLLLVWYIVHQPIGKQGKRYFISITKKTLRLMRIIFSNDINANVSLLVEINAIFVNSFYGQVKVYFLLLCFCVTIL